VQDIPRVNGKMGSNNGGASAVQSAWEPMDRSQEFDEEGHSRNPDSSAKPLSHEIIDVDAYDEESRYEIPANKRRKTTGRQLMNVETVFTTDSGSEDGEVIAVEEGRGTEDLEERDMQRDRGRIKIDRKRAFWASKGGTVVST
jgi:hypothetical protein